MPKFKVLFTEYSYRAAIIEAGSEEEIREAWSAGGGVNPLCDSIFDDAWEFDSAVADDIEVQVVP